MKERRSLVDGLKADPELQRLEETFVYGNPRKPEQIEPTIPAVNPQPIEPANTELLSVIQEEPKILPQMTGRIPVTTRCRPEVASALKRASLQRQLAGVEPYYVQDIMEAALETWLKEKGYV